jgi:hypothetical protein
MLSVLDVQGGSVKGIETEQGRKEFPSGPDEVKIDGLYQICSKYAWGCLQTGQIVGAAVPSWIWPHSLHFHVAFSLLEKNVPASSSASRVL